MSATSAAVEFRVLGSVELSSADPRRAELVLHQTKRLALLSYLVLARPRGYHRRDELLALFWPELDASRAHNALRQALHYLRRALGAAVVRGRGASDLGVDADMVWCDATEFERALHRGRVREGLAHYRGHLLPGFFVAHAAAEFDHWLDAERLRLRRLASEAAWAHCAHLESQGDVLGCIQTARQASELAGFDEIALRRLIELLERHGDHAGAMYAYDEFRWHVSGARGYGVSTTTTRLLDGLGYACPPVASSDDHGSSGWSAESLSLSFDAR